MPLKKTLWGTYQKPFLFLLIAVGIQVMLGIANLLLKVPVEWGVLHQFWGIIVFGGAIISLYFVCLSSKTVK